MNQLPNKFSLHDIIKILKEAVSTKNIRRLNINGLYPDLLPLFLYRLYSNIGMTLLLLCKDNDEISRVIEGLPLKKDRVFAFPEHDVPPYKSLSPERHISIERIETLFRIKSITGPGIIISTIKGIMRRVIPRDILFGSIIRVREGGTISRGYLIERLLSMGYLSSDTSGIKGFFYIRGGNVEIFPPLMAYPIRFELEGERVTFLREIDPETRRTVKKIDKAIILPVIEEVIDQNSTKNLESSMALVARERGIPSYILRNLLEDIRSTIPFGGRENLLPFFYQNLESLLDYLPERFAILTTQPSIERALVDNHDLYSHYFHLLEPSTNLFPRPESLLISHKSIEEAFDRRCVVSLNSSTFSNDEDGDSTHNLTLHSEPLPFKLTHHLSERFFGRFEPFLQYINMWLHKNYSIFYIHSSEERTRFLRNLIGKMSLTVEELEGEALFSKDTFHHPPSHRTLFFVRGEMRRGFVLPLDKMVFISENDLFRRFQALREGYRTRFKTYCKPLEIDVGDYIVHRDYGIGIFRGFERLEVQGTINDFLCIEYRGGDKLYLPVYRTGLIHKYISPKGATPQLDRLGSRSWLIKKGRVTKKIDLFAASLMRLYSERKMKKGFSFLRPDALFRQFEEGFEYEETPDQKEAIETVIKDMTNPSPMERLVCGDVGFGKTEIAMRAAFLALLSLKQVALLVPTTTLALQHYNTFKKRFSGYPVRIDMLSRLSLKREVDETLLGLQTGEVDIVIGTHKILSSSVKFKDLGLLIIDEEHKFGVTHKEKLRRLKCDVDTLYLSATPIPRTLQMSLSGLKDISLLSTPPLQRKPIKVSVSRFNQSIIKEAITYELKRDGQVFFIHNFIESIYSMERFLKKLVPEIKIGVCHGRMKERDIEDVMLSFYRRDFDLLLTTTLVESGIDIPSANTIIVNRADRYGLAQLYQLKGRVGRAGKQAFAYLLVPPSSSLSQSARERLNTILEYQELGSGFFISVKDLELRGAGDLLGRSQSGNISQVGFSLYTELLERSITALKGREVEPFFEPDINLGISAYIPERYIPDISKRLEYYLELTSSRSFDEIGEVFSKMECIYGKPTEEVENLRELMEIWLILKTARFEKLYKRGNRILLKPNPSSDIDTTRLIQQVEKYNISLTFHKDGNIILLLDQPDLSINIIKKILKKIFSYG